MAVARAVCWGFDLGAEQGYQILSNYFNPRCEPPWTESALLKRCRDAMNPTGFGKPRGYLLETS